MLAFLFYVFLLVIGIQLIYYLGIFGTFAFDKQNVSKSSRKIPISVIVCAKNEAKNLLENIPTIINQDYPNFEIVLINDASSDDSLEIMKSFEKKHANITLVDVKGNETFWGNKKYALTLGIKAAKYQHLLFTDADCNVISNQWISEMAKAFTAQKTVILGYSPYQKVKNSFLNALIQFETLITAVQYFSYAKIGIPYMGVGRNLAYHKSEFFKVKGFIKHMQLKSGDDDLLIKEIASKSNVAILYSPDSLTISQPKKTFLDWFRQKRRHVSTSAFYKKKHKFLLGTFYLSHVLFWGLFLTLILLNYNILFVVIIAFIKFLVQFIIYKNAFAKLHEKKIFWFTPFLEIFLIIFQFAIFITNSISKPSHWK